MQQNNTYIADGRLNGNITLQNGTQKIAMGYTYDKLGRMKEVYENGILKVTYTYDDNGNRESITYSNGNSTVYTYNLANKLVSLTNKKNGVSISQYTYTYYLNGNQASKTDTSGLTTYVYDGLGRLANVSEPGNITTTYQYDDYNNRSFMSVVDSTNTTTYTYEYNKLNRLLTETKKINDVISSTTNYQYDNNGNMTSDGISTYKYDGFNQLIEVDSGTNVYLYNYNGDGLRTSKVLNGNITNCFWEGDDIAMEMNSSGTAVATYLRGINLYASDIGVVRNYYMFNGHGDVTQLTDTAGNVVKSYEYDAFGVEKNLDPNDNNAFRYSSEYFDKEIGKIYLRARYYNPEIGRFITEDSYPGDSKDPQSLNLYTYCQNDPIGFTDPSGHALIFGSDLFKKNKKLIWNRIKSGIKWVGQKIFNFQQNSYNKQVEETAEMLQRMYAANGTEISEEELYEKAVRMVEMIDIVTGSYGGITKIESILINESKAVNWTNHGYKHFSPTNVNWKDIVRLTKSGAAKYKLGINVEALERKVWEEGTKVTNGKNWKVMKMDKIIGASNGKETMFIRVEESGGTIHGHPITEAEYNKLTK